MLVAVSGCAMLDKYQFVVPKDSYEPVHHLELAFHPFVYFIDDTVNPGNTIPCLKGRVYLIGEDGAKTLAGRGQIYAELYDTTAQKPGQAAPMIADWKFEPAALKMVQSPDKIGLGYTLFLPLVEYQASIKKVVLRVTYTDEKGEKRQHQNTLMLRVAEESPEIVVNECRNVLPNSLPPAPTPSLPTSLPRR